MTDLFSHSEQQAQKQAATVQGNVPEISVGELANSVKRTLENSFSRIRVRGEFTGLKLAGSGHLYGDLKDENAVINIVCWRGTMSRLSIRPEDGLEVIATGKVSSYPKSSRYQLVIESIELAGEGALLKMLEARKKALAAEGLFDETRKKPLPYLPDVIGVVTSPSGAVIRDIMHRLNDRFPRHVLLWPVMVQGKGANAQIAAAIDGFNAMQEGGSTPRPDLIIVARGGGSLEDLMAFNEENVVRAAANSSIPLISAVGHETDTTLIDYAADRRVPTPTGAAEIAVPVRADLAGWVSQQQGRMAQALNRSITERRSRLETASARLGDPSQIIQMRQQTLDIISEKVTSWVQRYMQTRQHKLVQLSSHIKPPSAVLRGKEQELSRMYDALKRGKMSVLETKKNALILKSSRLLPPRQKIELAQQKLDSISRLLDSFSIENTLQRGFTIIQDAKGKIVTNTTTLKKSDDVTIKFKDEQSASATINSINK